MMEIHAVAKLTSLEKKNSSYIYCCLETSYKPFYEAEKNYLWFVVSVIRKK